MRVALVYLHQQSLVPRGSPGPPEVDWTVRTGSGRITRLRRCAGGNDRPPDLIELIVVHARAEEPTRRAVNHVAVNKIGLQDHAVWQLVLHANIEMLSLCRWEFARIQSA